MTRAGLLRFACVVILVLDASVALASEVSERLYSRGLVEFHAGRFAPALTLFDQAVQADPRDIYALYYRGVTRGRLDDTAGAIADLRAVVAAKPDIEQATLELGVALVQANQNREAVPFLAQAQRVAAMDAKASLFLGVAQLRLGDLDAARTNLERATREPELRRAARYYQGLVAYRQGEWAEAEEHLAYVADNSPESDMGREAAKVLAQLRHGKRPNYRLYGALGFQYDSNVVLAPSDDVIKGQLGISRQSDGRATIIAGGVYVPWRTENAELSLGYEFYQSLHFDLTAFNLQDHRPSLQVAAKAGPLWLGFVGRYDYYFLETDSFLQEVTALPWVTIPEDNFGRTEFFYRMRRRAFLKQAFSGLDDAFNHATGIRQVVNLGSPDRSVALGYRFDREDPVNSAGNVFAYDGNEVNLGLAWALPAGISADATYAYRHEQYAPPSNGRHDDENEVVISGHKILSDHLGVTVAYLGDFNDSNKPAFDYDRHIVSVSVDVRF